MVAFGFEAAGVPYGLCHLVRIVGGVAEGDGRMLRGMEV